MNGCSKSIFDNTIILQLAEDIDPSGYLDDRILYICNTWNVVYRKTKPYRKSQRRNNFRRSPKFISTLPNPSGRALDGMSSRAKALSKVCCDLPGRNALHR